LSEKKEILFNPFDKQIQFIESAFSKEYDIILYGGAIRGGKTFAGIGCLLLLCKAFPSSRWAIVRVDLPTLKRNTIPSFKKICPQSFIKSYNQDTQTVTFNNGSQILFFAENYSQDKDLNRWKGLEVNGFLLEEINELQEQSFNKSIERAGSLILKEKQPNKLILATCNPTQNWVKKKFYDKYKQGILPKRWKYIPSKITDNKFIPKDYLESLKQLPSYDYEIFVNGNWEIKQKTGYEFYKYFNTDIHRNILKYDKNKGLHLSFDFNVVPYMTLTIWQVYQNNDGFKLCCIKEYITKPPKNNTQGICNEFLKEFGNHNQGVFIYGDPSGKKRDTRNIQGANDYTIIFNELKQFFPKDRVLKSAPNINSRGNFINNLFLGKINNCSIEIDVNCEKLITDLLMLKEDADGKKLKEKTIENGISFEKFGHCSDTMDYFICQILSNQYKTFIGKKRRLLS